MELAVPAPTAVVIEQLYLPGWEVSLDGRELARTTLDGSLTPEGFVRLALLQAGTHRLEAAYGGPPGGGVRAAGMALVLGVFALLLRPVRAAAPASGASGGAAPRAGHSTT